MNSHKIRPDLLSDRVKVLVVGAGGTGSEILRGLAKLHEAMVALGHPGGLHVTCCDDDTVSLANIGRQAFWPADVGSYKASVLINRINLGFGVDWTAWTTRLTDRDRIRDFDLVIGCVDTRASRAAILDTCRGAYYLDIGNKRDTGQVILGEIKGWKTRANRLPNAADLYPEIIDPEREGDDDTPSCSLAEALEKQGLFINQGLATHALSLLWELFRFGTIEHHGVYVNMKTGRVTPQKIDPEAWKRLGYDPK